MKKKDKTDENENRIHVAKISETGKGKKTNKNKVE